MGNDKKCDCKLCQRTAKMRKIIRKLESKEDKDFLESIYDDLLHSEDDACYWKLKYNGSWPNDQSDLILKE